jgi:hypothetical protein
MLVQAQAGGIPSQSNKSGQNNLAQGWLNELLVTELYPKYAALAQNANLFTASSQAATAVSLLSTATATGYILSNPAGSGKNLVLLEANVQLAATEVATGTNLVLAFNNNPVAAAVVHTTPLTVSSTLIGAGASSVAKVDGAATLPAVPTALRPIGMAQITFGTAATAGLAQVATVKEIFDGSIVISPGTSISLATITTTISILAAFTWAETPV